MMTGSYGFGRPMPVPCSAEEQALGLALCALVKAEKRLEKSRSSVPDYTGQWSAEDYFADELADWYEACRNVRAALAGDVALRGSLLSTP